MAGVNDRERQYSLDARASNFAHSDLVLSETNVSSKWTFILQIGKCKQN